MAARRPRRAYWRRDILYVYHNLDEKDATKEGAPTGAAWGLLVWARKNRDKFYEKYLKHVLDGDAKQEAAKAEKAAMDVRDEKLIRELKACLKQLKTSAGVG